ncbi:NAD(P)-dependent oxidoreductase [Maridesulfovibrio sp. FT414]|uniref:NAD(P)-dependent oxidoreductase n=1 Tax=Maridesulfovibrio sp. FT414 TaxID=2979469 RepID=UPI003D800F66
MKPTLIYYSISKYREENKSLLHRLFDIIELDNPSFDTPEILAKASAIIAPLGYYVGQEKMDRMPNLKVIGSNTTGHPHIDVEYAAEKGIAVHTLKYEKNLLKTITPTAELTWGLIIAVTRNMRSAMRSVIEGNWDRRPFGGPAMLSRMSLGLAGLGRLGSIVAEYGLAFGMKVSFYDPYITEYNQALNRVDSLEELVSSNDIISIHIPHEPETENIFDRNTFDKFKNGAYFINTSRGELVDHDALIDAMKKGILAGAAMDVFPDEFNPDFDIRKEKLWSYLQTHENLIVTPHIAGSTEDAWRLTERRTIDLMCKTLGLEDK